MGVRQNLYLFVHHQYFHLFLFRITVDTSFTIKGWLFPEEKDTAGNIYKIDNNFIAVDLQNRIYSPLDQQISNKSYIENFIII